MTDGINRESRSVELRPAPLVVGEGDLGELVGERDVGVDGHGSNLSPSKRESRSAGMGRRWGRRRPWLHAHPHATHDAAALLGRIPNIPDLAAVSAAGGGAAGVLDEEERVGEGRA